MTFINVFIMFIFFLSQDFKDIFSDEIPNRLPHIKGIKCQIDLVLGALYQIFKPIKVMLRR